MTLDTPQVNDGRRDIERAVADLAERLPAPLAPLARIAYNYRWAWFPQGIALFRDIDPAIWRRSECNPRYVIEAATPQRLLTLAQDSAYVERVQRIAAAIDADLQRPAADTPIAAARPIAYLCSEFGIHCSLPLYGGGLGVLAGDVLKAASDLALPMVGASLLYRYGYFHQRLDTTGWQHEYWTATNFERLPAVLVTGSNGSPLTVEMVIRDRRVAVQVWRIDVGRVPLYLLDTDREDNHPIDRWITSRLYIGDRHTRLAQYAVLGIGAVRALDALGIQPRLIHLNEGHAALSSFERVCRLMQGGLGEEEALALVRRETIFTTHTPVAAGNEGYREEEVEPLLSHFIDHLGLPRSTFYDLGRIHAGDRQEPANITPLALRTSRAANGVSRRHGEVARTMWHPLWPERSEAEVPITHVTNGVHTTTWMSHGMQSLLDRHLGADWRTRLDDQAMWERVADIPDADLWAVRCEQREALVRYVREQSMRDRLARGETADYVEAAARAFDPNTLTIGFARRMATYKRFYLLSRFPERGVRLLTDGPSAIQIIVAGKAHPQDDEAKHALSGFIQMKRGPEVARRIVFLEDYDLHMAPRLVSGVDLWLNLPRPPLEASGTSGMKVALNGGLNASVLDGWWAEAYDGENGWAIASPPGDPRMQDDHDASALLDLIELEVIPLFYKRDSQGIPRSWVQRIKASMCTLIPQFTANRMLHDYVRTMYAAAEGDSTAQSAKA
ncbi:MAG TPA: alpha-glucan family phosphorylase [Candidatus Margulisiibacteriota bacterium]|nr:alpha-glucan family phosphorylase [Candidatus Margulisiibacteriota bacterium]